MKTASSNKGMEGGMSYSSTMEGPAPGLGVEAVSLELCDEWSSSSEVQGLVTRHCRQQVITTMACCYWNIHDAVA